MGLSVSGAGTPKPSFYDAVVIGAPGYNANAGRAYVYYGNGTTFESTPTILNGESSGDSFGNSVARLGNTDADNYHDILIGAPFHDNGQQDEGKAYLFRGSGSGVSTTPAWTVESNQAFAHLGASVAGNTQASRADFDEDGLNDFVIGLPDYDTTALGKTDNGEAWFYLGGSTPTLNSRIIGGANNDHNGWSVAIGYLLPEGGVEDCGLIVGAPDATTSTVSAYRWTP